MVKKVLKLTEEDVKNMVGAALSKKLKEHRNFNIEDGDPIPVDEDPLNINNFFDFEEGEKGDFQREFKEHISDLYITIGNIMDFLEEDPWSLDNPEITEKFMKRSQLLENLITGLDDENDKYWNQIEQTVN